MTWKRCAGCTRAISATAFTCEYCGQVCDDVMDLLPPEEGEAANGLTADVSTLARGVEEPLEPVDTSDLWTGEPLPVDADASATYTAPGLFDAQEQASAVAAVGEAFDSTVEFPPALEEALNDPWQMADEVPLDVTAGESPTPVIDPATWPAPAASAPEPAVKPAAQRLGSRQIAVAGGGVIAAAALIFTILGMRGAASPEPAAALAPVRPPAATAPARPAAARPAPSAPLAAVPADAPRWSRVTDGRWVGTNRHSVAFEVSATGRVHVWMRDVTPVLVVRCDAGSTEAFVYTQSAARMEPQDGDHTVSVALDNSSPTSERWPDSAEHDALFARNSPDFTRRLAGSRTLRFGFTPHNAEPVMATFALDGLSEMMASAGRQCGIKKNSR